MLPSQTGANLKKSTFGGATPASRHIYIACEFGSGTCTTRSVVKRLGGKLQSMSDNNRKYACDHRFFDEIDSVKLGL